MLVKYKYILAPFMAVIICQLIKFSFESYEAKTLKWGRLFKGSGGMPSSHATLVFTLTFMIMLNKGISSIESAISLIFALIVAYDAMGVRMESGRQAETINHIIDEIFSRRVVKGFVYLKEELGHKPMEVLMGICLAFCFSLLYNFVII